MEYTYIFVLMNLWEAIGEKVENEKNFLPSKSVNLDDAINFEKTIPSVKSENT